MLPPSDAQQQVIAHLTAQKGQPKGSSPIPAQSAEQALATQLPPGQSAPVPAAPSADLPQGGFQELVRRAPEGDPLNTLVNATGTPWNTNFEQTVQNPAGDGNFQTLPLGTDPQWQQFAQQEGGMTFAPGGQPGNMQLEPQFANIQQALLAGQGDGTANSSSPVQAALRALLDQYLVSKGQVQTGPPMDPGNGSPIPWTPQMFQTGKG